jgi:hypothetical protein
VEVRSLGGALNREPAAPNAVATRGIPFFLFGFGIGGPEQADIMRSSLATVIDWLEPWSDSRLFPNFLSPDEATTPDQLRTVYGAKSYERLAAIKKAHDPSNMFRMNHNIVPA